MRPLFVTLVLFALGAAAAGAAGNTASVAASTSKHGAPVALTFKLSYPMQCGNPGRTLTVQLPASMKVPPSIERQTVRVNGSAATSVKLRGSTVSIAIGSKQWLDCKVRGSGKLSVVITAGAGLANPSSPGVYGFPVAIDRILGNPKLRLPSRAAWPSRGSRAPRRARSSSTPASRATSRSERPDSTASLTISAALS